MSLVEDARSSLDALSRCLRVGPKRDLYWWFGRKHQIVAIPPANPADVLVEVLSRHLYSHWYTHGWPMPKGVFDMSVAMPGPVATELVRLFPGNGLDHGWYPNGAKGNRATKGGVTIELRGTHVDQLVDDALVLRVPRVLPDASPGFVVVHGLAGAALAEVRLYWHAPPATRVELTRTLAEILDHSRIPYTMKVLKDPFNDRADSVVTYLSHRSYVENGKLWVRAAAQMHALVAPDVPALTARLSPGLSVAMDPGNGDSFGQVVARRVAEQFSTGRAQVLPSALLAAVADAGIFADSAKLVAATNARIAPRRPKVGGSGGLRLDDTLRAVVAYLKRAAVSAGGMTSWLEPPDPGNHIRRPSERGTTRVADGSLYGGTAGVAVFLGEYSRQTGDPDAAMLARAALTYSFSDVGRLRGRGLFDGQLGVAVAAANVGISLDDAGILASSRSLAEAAALEPPRGGNYLSGRAGFAAATAALGACHGSSLLRAAALSAAETLAMEKTSARDRHAATSAGVSAHGMYGSVGRALGLAIVDSFYPAPTRAAHLDDIVLAASTKVNAGLLHYNNGSWCDGLAGLLMAATARGGRPAAVLTVAKAAVGELDRIAQRQMYADWTNLGLCHGASGIAAAIAGAGGDAETLCRRLVVGRVLKEIARPTPVVAVGLMNGIAGAGLAMLYANQTRRMVVGLPGIAATPD